ncbi:hypothetical protein FHU13_003300 [Methylobacterium sp. R2-1]|nr:hypothetical protein [Methylobacterium sp. R2-1]
MTSSPDTTSLASAVERGGKAVLPPSDTPTAEGERA